MFQTFEVDVNCYNYRAASHTYRLTFHPHTVFLPDSGAVPRSIPTEAYSFKPISDIFTIPEKDTEKYLLGTAYYCY